MRKHLLIIFAGFLLAAGIAGQIIVTPEKNTASTPTPTPKKSINCEMPRPSPSESATPIPTPQQERNNPRYPRERRSPEMLKAIALQLDYDCDGISNYDDNCIAVPNADQKDRNKNGIGDVCEQKGVAGQIKSNSVTAKTDLNPVPAQKPKIGCMMPTPSLDPTVTPNPKPRKNASRSLSSVWQVLKSSDWDCDGISDYNDNCRFVYNPKQKDKNKNGFGDVCEPKRLKSRSRFKNKRN